MNSPRLTKKYRRHLTQRSLANDKTGRVRVTFADGQQTLAPRFAVRKITNPK